MRRGLGLEALVQHLAAGLFDLPAAFDTVEDLAAVDLLLLEAEAADTSRNPVVLA